MEKMNIPEENSLSSMEGLSQDEKRSENLRKELEQFPFYKKSPEQWSDNENMIYSSWCTKHFSNFWWKLHQNLNKEWEKWENYNTPIELIKKTDGFDDEYITRSIKLGEHSDKLYKGSYRNFWENIEQALNDNKVDIGDLQEKIELKQQLWLQKQEDMNDEVVNEDLRKQIIDNDKALYVTIVPTIMDLIDQGYTVMDLSS